ncbi:MAG TPA: SDR family NAD(P)-dependent oxidoreductase, partial [Novosphingobium sp.]|nr:SDR family NAD(P)-dependent oxidoreductase [Novosphingobium sp.]
MSDFTGRTAIVTGAASGIGAATARLLRERGALVRGLDLNGNGDDITALDVADMAAVTDAIDTIAARDGLDILVNCAGTGRLHTIYDVTLQDWQAVLDVNLGGTFAACRAASAHMVRAGRGAIINIGSTFGLLARENG